MEISSFSTIKVVGTTLKVISILLRPPICLRLGELVELLQSSGSIIHNTRYFTTQPWKYSVPGVADADHPGEVGGPHLGHRQEVDGGAERGAPSLLPLPACWLQADVTGAAGATAPSAVQQVLQVKVAGGDQVGGGGVEGGELEDGVVVLPL